MFQPVILNGTQFPLMEEVFRAAQWFHGQRPTENTQLGINALMSNNGYNDFSIPIYEMLTGILRDVPQLPKDALDAFILAAAELAICRSATTVRDAQYHLGQAYDYMVSRRKELGGLLENITASFKQAPQYVPQQSQYAPQRSHYMPADDPYAGQRSVYAAHNNQGYAAQSQGAHMASPYDLVNNQVQSQQVAHAEVYDDVPNRHDFNTPTYGHQAPARPAKVNPLDLFDEYSDPAPAPTRQEPVARAGNPVVDSWDTFSSGIEDIVSEPLETPVTDELTRSPESANPYINEEERAEMEARVSYTEISSIEDVDLFSLDEEWLRSGEVERGNDGSVFGAVIIAGKLHLPVSPDDEAYHPRLNHVEFWVAKLQQGDRIITERVYLNNKELPVDYETLSPNPIILDEVESPPLTPRMAAKEEIKEVQHGSISFPETSDNLKHPMVMAANLITYIRGCDERPNKLKVGMFVGHELEALCVVDAASAEEALAGLPRRRATDVELIYTDVDAPFREAFRNRLDGAMAELMNHRFKYEGNTWGDVVKNWETIMQKVIEVGDHSSEEVGTEFKRAIDSVAYGSEVVAEDLGELFPTEEEAEDDDIMRLAMITGSGLNRYSINVRRPYAILSSWLTNDEMGITEDGFLSESTNSDIAALIISTFDENPTLTSIKILDVDSQESMVYRGIGKRRARISID